MLEDGPHATWDWRDVAIVLVLTVLAAAAVWYLVGAQHVAPHLSYVQ